MLEWNYHGDKGMRAYMPCMAYLECSCGIGLLDIILHGSLDKRNSRYAVTGVCQWEHHLSCVGM